MHYKALLNLNGKKSQLRNFVALKIQLDCNFKFVYVYIFMSESPAVLQ